MVVRANATVRTISTMKNTVKTLPMTTMQIAIAVHAPPKVMEPDA